ncbi:MAG: zinc ribbon domain-containing protein [Chloroflexota bacterium]|nr:zinc ribbon domain-containing protein [Chloroflexota bacterium]
MFDDIFGTIGTEIGKIFDNPAVRLGLQVIGIYIVFIWLATAFWAYRDMSQRTTNPIAPYLAAALIILFTPLLFLFGVVIYRILRPGTTVAEANERALAEEAMLVEIESQPHCANCSRQVHADWIICPTCRNRLRRVCPNCSRLVELDWSLCAWCGKDFERPELLREVAVPPPVGRPVAQQAGRQQDATLPAIPSRGAEGYAERPVPGQPATGER